jgi:hypothetical protein
MTQICDDRQAKNASGALGFEFRYIGARSSEKIVKIIAGSDEKDSEHLGRSLQPGQPG